MIRIDEKGACAGCFACAASCPKSCISMQPDEEGFLYPSVDGEKCINCGLCERVCPVMKNKEKADEPFAGKAYGAYARDEAIREKSSSGGLFTLLATAVLRRGGVVFGASFDEKMKLSHRAIESEEELSLLRGSKYLQSEIGDSYQKAKAFLSEGRPVYFSGTPCQIAGLRSYLGKEYEGLITQDLVCHGVPSPFVFRQYLAYKGKEREGVTGLSFRDKREGWRRYGYALSYGDGGEGFSVASHDEMGKLFQKDLCLRPSCYACAFKGASRESDITLADFWGVEKVAPTLDDGKGTSLCILHTEKGKNLFEAVREKTVCEAVSLEECLPYNASMLRFTPLPKGRAGFMKEVVEAGFYPAYRKYTRVPLSRRLLVKLKRAIKRIIR